MRLVYPLLWSRLGRSACREQTINTVAALARKDVEVTLLMPQRAEDPSLSAQDIRDYFDVEGEFRIVQRPSRWAGEFIVPSTLWTRRIFEDPEVLRSDLLLSRIPAMLALGGGSPIPFASDHYRPWPDNWPWLRPLIRRTAANPHCLGFILHSEFAAESYARTGIPDRQMLVAHNGADPRRMMPRLSKEEARTKLGLPQDRSIAVYAGRVNEKKGLDQVLALAALRPETLFLLVGSEGEGPVEAAARSLANVRIFGWQEPGALPPFLYAADLLLVPAARAPLEQFRNCVLPLKLFQYLAAGRPILAPVAPDTAELLTDGETALLVPADQPELAGEALDRTLKDRALADRLAASAERLSAELSWDHRAEKVLSFLSRRLEEVGARTGPESSRLFPATA